MNWDATEIVRNISEIAPMLHTAGPMSPRVINAIYKYIKDRKIESSVETGSGASTLLLSHFSGKHLVFAQDDGSGSVSNIKKSPLFNKSTVQFVEGPTQKTLPHAVLPGGIQFALIDGPHAYPFPDLEYYYIYPTLAHGAILVLDDIHIRTVNHLFSFLKEDSMFRLEEVVETTAFFTRTTSPTFCPTGDGWESQHYNRILLHRYDWQCRVRNLLPPQVRRLMKSAIRSLRTGGQIQIDTPQEGDIVNKMGLVSGRARSIPSDSFLWILIRRDDQASWWPQGGAPVSISEGKWQCNVEYGGSNEPACFEIAAILAKSSVNDYLRQWVADAKGDQAAPISGFPFRGASIAESYRKVRRVISS